METIYLKDYIAPAYTINKTNLEFNIESDKVIVTSSLDFSLKAGQVPAELFLDGKDLKLIDIKIDDTNLDKDSYKVDANGLTLLNLKDSFTLKTKVEIDPYNNLTGEGLYKSGDIFCTQCEAEGFRKITYFYDRPDSLSKFTVKIIADEKFPQLLSNGNKIEEGKLDNGKHFAVWEDPYNKPCYLFALVVGDLALATDHYKTKSGREVLLEIYVDKGNEDKTSFAMESLKNSMKWDEDRFRLEYDLDRYMIVAVESFNMGAMENKGLNIFNSAYVLAKQETATDQDFHGVEAVIGHEYFHNWTGNRITCRDWFQLTLKEGLTVFRDQEFSSDMGSRAVNRISNVKLLKAHQFPEDAGAFSHPIKPKEYSEINNFYTSTVYEKGSEVIRMIHAILGEENFQKGMDLYVERFDGMAVTTEDFVQAMSDASGVDLTQFKVWYDQSGTPEISISEEFANGEYKVTFSQEVKTNNTEFNSVHMPFHFNLYSKDGSLLESVNYELKEKSDTLVFKLDEKPYASWNIGFCAPVKVNYEYTPEHLAFLGSHCKDEFNQYNAFYTFTLQEIYKLVAGEESLSSLYIDSFRSVLKNTSIDDHFKSLCLQIPSAKDLNEALDTYNIEGVAKALKGYRNQIATLLSSDIETELNSLKSVLDKSYNYDLEGVGARSLRLTLLNYIKESKHEEIKKYFDQSTNMTDEIGMLKLLIDLADTSSVQAFYNKWKHEPLVLQKWFQVQVLASSMTLNKIDELVKVEGYDKSIPNFLRSIYTSLTRNISLFNTEDGSGYEYLANAVIEIDSYNPQVASRFVKSFSHGKKLDQKRKAHLENTLKDLATRELSRDTKEIVEKALATF